MLPVYLIVLSLRISLSIYYSFACLWLFTLSVQRICVYHSLRRLSSTIDYLLAYISLASSASSFSSCPPPPFSSSNCLLFLIFFLKKSLFLHCSVLRLSIFCQLVCLTYYVCLSHLSPPVCLFTYLQTLAPTHMENTVSCIYHCWHYVDCYVWMRAKGRMKCEK